MSVKVLRVDLERAGFYLRCLDARRAVRETGRGVNRAQLIVGYWSLVVGYWLLVRRMINDQRPITNDQ